MNGTQWNVFREDEQVNGESKIDLFNIAYEFLKKNLGFLSHYVMNDWVQSAYLRRVITPNAGSDPHLNSETTMEKHTFRDVSNR